MSLVSAEPIFRIHAELGEIQHFGESPYGERRVIDITGGWVEGARLRGRVIPGGADWQIVRRDGVFDLDARYAIEAEDGARILVRSAGLRHGAPEVLAALQRGEAIDPSHYYFRTAMRFETGSTDLAWLNRILALGRGVRDRLAVRLDVYEVL